MKSRLLSPRSHGPAVLRGALSLLLAACALAQGQVALPANWAYPAGSGNPAAPGFTGSIRQARQDTDLTATIARGNAHLRDELVDPFLDPDPYDNLAVNTDNPDVGAMPPDRWPGDMAVNPDGSFAFDGVINFTAEAATGLSFTEGNFTGANGFPDRTFPGLPGNYDYNNFTYTNFKNFSVEFLGFLELPAGQTTLTVRNDDAMQLAFHPNDARDIFRAEIVGFDTNAGPANRAVTLDVAQAGLYSFRLLHVQWNGLATLELYTNAAGPLALVNGSVPGGLEISRVGTGSVQLQWTGEGTLKESPDLVTSFSPSANQNNPQTRAASGKRFFLLDSDRVLPVFQSLTSSSRPYISDISPGSNKSGVESSDPIVITMENRNGSGITMTVEGTTVTPSIVDNGSTSTITYTPPIPFPSGTAVDVHLTYGNASADWTYIIKTGAKALLFASSENPGPGTGDSWVAARLATEFGLDVTIKSSTEINEFDAESLALQSDLVYVSSSVLGNNANSNAVFSRISSLAVPIICVEQASVDELGIKEGFSANVPAQGQTNTIVIDAAGAAHPAAGGLMAGSNVVSTVGNEQHHFADAPANGILIGQLPPYDGGLIRDVHWVVESGEIVNGTAVPARRAFFGFVGNNGAASLNVDGVALWDSLITWMLTPP